MSDWTPYSSGIPGWSQDWPTFFQANDIADPALLSYRATGQTGQRQEDLLKEWGGGDNGPTGYIAPFVPQYQMYYGDTPLDYLAYEGDPFQLAVDTSGKGLNKLMAEMEPGGALRWRENPEKTGFWDKYGDASILALPAAAWGVTTLLPELLGSTAAGAGAASGAGMTASEAAALDLALGGAGGTAGAEAALAGLPGTTGIGASAGTGALGAVYGMTPNEAAAFLEANAGAGAPVGAGSAGSGALTTAGSFLSNTADKIGAGLGSWWDKLLAGDAGAWKTGLGVLGFLSELSKSSSAKNNGFGAGALGAANPNNDWTDAQRAMVNGYFARPVQPFTWRPPIRGYEEGGEVEEYDEAEEVEEGGQSDTVPAMLSPGEYVFDAETVSALGDGDTETGAAILDEFRQRLRAHKRSAPASQIPPKARAPEAYLPRRAK